MGQTEIQRGETIITKSEQSHSPVADGPVATSSTFGLPLTVTEHRRGLPPKRGEGDNSEIWGRTWHRMETISQWETQQIVLFTTRFGDVSMFVNLRDYQHPTSPVLIPSIRPCMTGFEKSWWTTWLAMRRPLLASSFFGDTPMSQVRSLNWGWLLCALCDETLLQSFTVFCAYQSFCILLITVFPSFGVSFMIYWWHFVSCWN